MLQNPTATHHPSPASFLHPPLSTLHQHEGTSLAVPWSTAEHGIIPPSLPSSIGRPTIHNPQGPPTRRHKSGTTKLQDTERNSSARARQRNTHTA